MALLEQVNEGIKQAMLSRDKVRLEALRGIKKEFLEAMTAKGAAGELDDDHALKIIAKLVKQREESASLYRDADRLDLAEAEEAEAEVYRSFLPAQLSEEEITEKVKEMISKLGVTDIKGMGQVMGVATKELGASADGKLISQIVRKLLS
ncbi:GatB/YqeY domain-containing protein [Porphyromonas somerae]|uniref:GatB/YqeY domain-containing protein n=1 Tax=Porphyromonas somerae TaxID=322095 RepID=UPI00033B2193|nr:GatB/YqeY domain-containing protein [Porphyromonas somerae]MDD7558196.1 GatB/YqeY domain-containing protein [Porphyromonas somerae]MDY3884739.1 GatB/YqeY domain-containing protein [Porphyromonas somerae]MDY5816242.1 GatB/YqeY domain-containing protein [Porphyromonas somerae]CCY10197.1 yqeY family protein [Porphyromonas sp. CAG:1061]